MSNQPEFKTRIEGYILFGDLPIGTRFKFNKAHPDPEWLQVSRPDPYGKICLKVSPRRYSIETSIKDLYSGKYFAVSGCIVTPEE